MRVHSPFRPESCAVRADIGRAEAAKHGRVDYGKIC